jgi:peptide chain release factor 1
LTDHRIGLTLHNLPQLMDGEIWELIEALQAFDLESRLADLL